MTAHHARPHARHTRAAAPAAPLARSAHVQVAPAHLAHLHPDWLPPGGNDAHGAYRDPADDLATPNQAALSIPPPPIPFTSATLPRPTDFPVGLQPTVCHTITRPAIADPLAVDAVEAVDAAASCGMPASATPLPSAPGAPPASASGAPPRAGAGAWGERSPNPDDEHEDENVIFHAAYLPGGRETQLVHTALPLRHRIYALHCQGRSISAIARRLRLDRGTVARHLHAVEDLLLAEQTADLARLRLRAVEAQHAILAAAWDALLCEELTESDDENAHPYPARRAQLLATAARAARTAAQLQGLFTPAALAAALRDLLPADATPAASVVAHRDTPDAGSERIGVGAPDTPPSRPTGLPRACNSRAGSPTTPVPAARSASGSPPLAGEGRGERSASASPLPRTGARIGEGSAVDPPLSCGMPASVHAAVAPPPIQPGLSREPNSRAGSPTTPLPTADPSAVDSDFPAREGGWGVRSVSGSPFTRT